MQGNSIFDNLLEAFMYMERYVNDGSPSGWTKLRSTSKETNPFTGKDKFPILEFDDDDLDCLKLGEKNSLFENNVNYAHPDSFNSEILKRAKRRPKKSSLQVSPTSGGRTMLIRSSEFDGFIKLTYDIGRIGRVDRQLQYGHCMSSIEVSNSIRGAIDRGLFKNTYGTLLEKSAKVSKLMMGDSIYEWGTILRERQAYPYVAEKRQMIPGFSLFGRDCYCQETITDELLINQFIELSQEDPKTYLLNVMKMTIDAWFETLLNCAFILELHGQNCYYEIDEHYIIKRIIIKDMDSVDKDITLARKLGLNDKWKSYPFECFYEDVPENHPWYYKIRPSYMYDFKLGTYLLYPIMCAVCKRFGIAKDDIRNQLKEYVSDVYMAQIPRGYFPEDGTWYDCDNTERKPGERRKYFAHQNPLFR